MKKPRNTEKIFIHCLMAIAILLSGLFAGGAWAQQVSILSQTPASLSFNNPINTEIRIQFNQTMNTSATWIDLLEEDEIEIPGTTQWSQTSLPNDTLIFTPNHALKPAAHYVVECNAVPQSGWGNFFDFAFITRPSTADATPPAVQTVYPIHGATGISTTTNIYIKFSEAMNPPSVFAPGNITLTGPGISGPADYSVNYDFYEGGVEIRKNTPFSHSSAYTVTITTNVRDARLNPLKNQYQWGFTTGASDTTPPAVTQTIPAAGASKVSLNPTIHAIFSEEMDENSFTSANISLYNLTAGSDVPVNIYWSDTDLVVFGPQSQLINGNQYRVTLGTGIKDRSGNGLSFPYIWTFTVAGSGVDSAPVIQWGTSIDSHLGTRWWNGMTNLKLELGAWDDLTNPLTVNATAPGKSWTLTKVTAEGAYRYESSGDEGLSSGTHTITFTIKDGASPQNTVTFQRTIFIFDASPSLSSPSNVATGVSTTPTFQWTYGGTFRPTYYAVFVFDGPNPETANTIWRGFRIDSGSGMQSVTIPIEKKLKPNTTYYWGVGGINFEDTGLTRSDIRSFTTGAAPIPSPPFPRFARAFVRSDDRPGGMQWNAMAQIPGLSPSDISELKVEGPGGFRYIFTEEDILQGEQSGLYFWRMMPGSLPNGTYTFTLTDSLGRTATFNYDFTNPTTTIPRVNAASMVPSNNSFSVSTTPTFQWGSIGPGNYYYRVRVMDWNGRTDAIYISPFIQETQLTIPSGYLMANTSYKWRVEVYDGSEIKHNRSVSQTYNFFTGPQVLNLFWGIITADNEHYMGQRAALNALVRGAFPNSITQFSVTGPGSFSFNFTEGNVGYNFMLQGNFYGGSVAGYPPDGNYTFTAQVSGGSDSYLKAGHETNPIPIVDQSSMLPANNAYLTTLTPTFSWNLVSGSPRYYRIVINSWMTNYIIYQSPRTLDQTSFTIPAGILKANQSYKWRVQVYDHQDGLEAENSSNSGWNAFTIIDSKKIIDFDGNGKSDVLWMHPATGTVALWMMDGTSIVSVGVPGAVPSDWEIKGTGDFNNDGKSDVLWFHPATGTVAIWQMDGTSIASVGVPGAVPNDWEIKGTGDFNADGKSDVLWFHPATGTVAVWQMDGMNISSVGVAGAVPTGWEIKGTGDFNNDGKSDVLWFHPATGTVAIWQMDGTSIASVGVPGAVPNDWAIKGTGDFNNDGKSDVLWFHPATGTVALWMMDGTSIASVGVPGAVPSDWEIKGTGDFNNDGKSDVLWFHPTTGTVALWMMDGMTISSVGVAGAVPTGWEIKN